MFPRGLPGARRRALRAALGVVAALALPAATAGTAAAAYATPQTVTAVGAGTYSVPAGVSRLKIQAWGGTGGLHNGTRSGTDGLGGKVTGVVHVPGGASVAFVVGGAGRNGAEGGAGGTGGGGAGGTGLLDNGNRVFYGGGGGGATSLTINSTLALVAGGGGGHAGSTGSACVPGAGGGPASTSGGSASCAGLGGGYGGTQIAGGATSGNATAGGGPNPPTVAAGGTGGDIVAGGFGFGCAGGGGGGGLAGGGGGAGGSCSCAAGGGGSSGGPTGGDPNWGTFAAGVTTAYAVEASGNTTGADPGTSHGKLVITPLPNAPVQLDVAPGHQRARVAITASAVGGQPGSFEVIAYAPSSAQAGTCVVNADATPLQCTVTGLTNGTAYTFKARAYEGALVSGAPQGAWSDLGTATAATTIAPDVSLAALALSAGTLSPAFTANTTTYTATVANAVTTVDVTPTVGDPGNADVAVNGAAVASGAATPVALAVGANVITVRVDAPDDSLQRAYVVTVTRYSVDVVVSDPPAPVAAGAGSAPGQGASSPAAPVLRVTESRAQGDAVATEVVAAEAGTITSIGTAPLGRSRANRRACSATLRVAKAGRYTVVCRLTATARAALRTKALRVSVTTTLRGRSGATTSVTKAVVLPARR